MRIMMTGFVLIVLFGLFNAELTQSINNFQINKTINAVTLSTTATINLNDAFNINPPNCGKGPSSSFRIVGGTKAKPGDWNWQGLMLVDGIFNCGGSLINSQWVVTAAHCVLANYRDPSFYTFRFGVNDRFNPESWSEIRNISEIHIHHSYNPSYSVQNDIALFKLSTPIEYSDYINPICIPKDSSSFTGKNAWATGWGRLSGNGPFSQYLMQISVHLLNDTQCLEHFPIITPKIHVCASEENNTVCNGDSGGPLAVQETDNRWYLGGISSFVKTLNCDSTAVFVRVSFYYDWILSTIRDGPIGNSNSTITSLAVLKNGYLAGGSLDSTIKIWNTDTNTLKRTLKGHSLEIISLAVLQNGYLASASHDATIKIWNTEDGSLIRTLTGHSGAIISLAVLQNGYLASGGFDKTIKIWNTDDGSLIRTLSGDIFVFSLAVLQNGYLASGVMDSRFNGKIKIWNTADGSLIRTLNGYQYIFSLAVLQNGYLASTNGDGTIKIWNADTGSLINTLKGHLNQIKSLAVLKNGYLASASLDATIKIWNADDGSLITTLREHTGDVYSLAVLQNGYLASSSKDDSIIIWN